MPRQESPVHGFDVKIEAPELIIDMDLHGRRTRHGYAQFLKEIITNAFMGEARILNLVVERELIESLVRARWRAAGYSRIVP